MGSVHDLFRPARVAIVGATERSESVGEAVTQNLLRSFTGDVIPINPNTDSVFGIETLDSVADAGDLDLVVITVPPDIALSVIEQCGESGVVNVVVITAGFGEAGSEGAARERKMIGLAEKYDLNIVGPNSLGIMSTPSGLNATFGPDAALPGNMSFLSQSGAFVTAVIDWANDQQIGFRHIVSLGNKAVLDETDFLREWGDDPDTDVIIGYLEGIDDGQSFIDTAFDVTRDTPVVVVKSGRTDAGIKAVSSHTGSLAGSERAYQAGLRQAGVLRAETVQDLFDTAQILSSQPLPSNTGVGVVTNAGGPGVMATDAIGSSSLSMAGLSEETKASLREVTPHGASVRNPVDILGDADAERFRDSIRIVMDDDNVGLLLVLTCPTAVLGYDELAAIIVEEQGNVDLPMATCLMGGVRVRSPRRRLIDAGIPCYFDPTRAVRGLEGLANYARIRDMIAIEPDTFDVDRARAHDILAHVKNRETNRLGVEAMGLLEAYGIPTPESEIVNSVDAARRAATGIGEPVAMKIVSPDVVHKTDIGAVKLDVALEDVEHAYEEIITRVRNYQEDAMIFGIQVQAMIDLEDSIETIVGMNRDPQFGPLLMFGLGGIFVEIVQDTTFRVAPIAERDAWEMTEELDAAQLLRGVRGRHPVDMDALVEALQRLSQLATDFPAIDELDINPLVASPDGIIAIDIRLTVNPEQL